MLAPVAVRRKNDAVGTGRRMSRVLYRICTAHPFLRVIINR